MRRLGRDMLTCSLPVHSSMSSSSSSTGRGRLWKACKRNFVIARVLAQHAARLSLSMPASRWRMACTESPPWQKRQPRAPRNPSICARSCTAPIIGTTKLRGSACVHIRQIAFVTTAGAPHRGSTFCTRPSGNRKHRTAKTYTPVSAPASPECHA